MKRYSYISEIRILIAKDELTKAIDLLRDLIIEKLPEHINQVTILSMEIYSLKKAIIIGRVSWEEELNAKNKIAFKVLELVSLLELEYPVNLPLADDQNSIKKNFKRA